MPEKAAEVAGRIAQLGKPAVVVSFGDPYGAAALPLAASTYMLAWNPHAPIAQVAAARAIAGVAPITGVLPIDIGATARGTGIKRGTLNTQLTMATPAQAGMSESLAQQIDSIINAAIADSATPGEAIAVGRHDKLVHVKC